MGYLVINAHRSKIPFSTWWVLELHQNSFLGSSWDLYGAIKRTGPSRSGKFSLNGYSIGLRKVLSSRPESGPNVHIHKGAYFLLSMPTLRSYGPID